MTCVQTVPPCPAALSCRLPFHLGWDLRCVYDLCALLVCITCPPVCPALCPHALPSCRLHFDLGLDLRCVYELDSSTPAKFSRHLTLRLPGHAFANNHAMGKFVAQVGRWAS